MKQKTRELIKKIAVIEILVGAILILVGTIFLPTVYFWGGGINLKPLGIVTNVFGFATFILCIIDGRTL